MQDLKIREEKMKAKRMNTPRRDFVKEIASWMPMVLYKNNWMITPYNKDINRIWWIMNPQKFEDYRINMPEIHYTGNIITNSANIFYSSSIHASNNIRWCSNLIGCSFCINCHDLVNQSYCVDNNIVGKDIFEKALHDFNSNKVSLEPWNNVWENITWTFNRLCYDVENGYMNYQLKDARNVVFCNAMEPLEHAFDCVSLGWLASDNIYACMGVGYHSHHVYCSLECSPNCSQIYYSYLMDSCSYCLGCIWLKNKSFCILNKQYTKEERFDLANKIFEKMESDWTLWQFFPWTMNPFYFNDTAAYLIDDSFTKEEVIAEWYLRRDEEIKVDVPEWADVVKNSELNDYQWFDAEWNWTINPEILKKVIKDEKWNCYRIIPMELEFLQKHGLPQKSNQRWKMKLL